MSTHLMAVRANLHLKKGVTLPMVWDAIAAFTERFDILLQDGWVIPAFGEMPLADPDDTIELRSEDGLMHMYLTCCASCGTDPDELPSLCEALEALVRGGGAIEIVDLEASPSNDDAISVRFVGADETQRAKARVDYGLGLAEEWLVGVIGPTDYQAVSARVHELAAKRLVAL
ncbi:hypothetical protein [Rubrivivax gelatinosus]|uniref:hypothetical protein n=1 Tax=Rubrivivax gelatinosus TaxID=28068 RepID=UPI0005C1C5C4|nr:hypothetical protein [Rubrivivax gelatinosus]MBG6083061.1 hypothetical protein [Rubrivivax gelatinosus]